ncbi:hypothetical protein RNI52_34605 [Labrys neptuniae]|uniref:hypothetical protein n=1 Tax=Labrys neptuniae TaxID=376174 RepID=UPI0028921462|nr:hypothetical protein [Labrys neptuniae]MDT3382509.1 hypothetical protein [Labrys neptuniae]
MRVTSFSPHPARPGDIARFDVEISPDLTLQNIRLRLNPAGVWRTYPQSSGSGRCSARFSTALSDALAELGLAAAREHGIPLD